jgi:hypothetical protein
MRRNNQPDRYVSLLGDTVVGGTSWIYLSDIPLERLGVPNDLPAEPVPARSWRLMSQAPAALAVLAVFFGAISRLIGVRHADD